MNKQEKEILINAWISCNNSERGSSEYEENFWAADKLMDLEFDDPELLWELILKIAKKELTARVKANLSAGPIESLLAHHGERKVYWSS